MQFDQKTTYCLKCKNQHVAEELNAYIEEMTYSLPEGCVDAQKKGYFLGGYVKITTRSIALCPNSALIVYRCRQDMEDIQLLSLRDFKDLINYIYRSNT